MPLPHPRVVLAVMVLATAAVSPAVAQTIVPRGEIDPATGMMRLDANGRQQVGAAVLGPIGLATQQQGSKLYVHFEIDPQARAPQQSTGPFAQPLRPQGAPIVREGLMEIVFQGPSIGLFPIGNSGQWSGSVNITLLECRTFEAGRPPTGNLLGMPHRWIWKAAIQRDELRLTFDTPSAYRANDPLTEIVSAIYNISPDRVLIAKPTRAEMENLVIDPGPVRRPQPWRASPYGGGRTP